jgi:hypothetical protein
MNIITFTTNALIVAVLSILALPAEEAPKLPPAAQAILDTAERAIAANRAKYDDANKKPLADAEKALKAKQDELGKAGKLEEALAIKKILDSFRDELVAKVDEMAMEKAGDLLGDGKMKSDWYIGKWGMTGNSAWVISLSKDGAATSLDGSQGKWEFKQKNLVISWNSGFIDSIEASRKGLDSYTMTNNKGGSYSVFFMKDGK